MNSRPRWIPWVFPGLLLISLAAHGAVLATGRLRGEPSQKPMDSPAEVLAVLLVEPAPPEAVEPPTPELTPPPEVVPDPPTPEAPTPEPVITQAVEEAPAPTPAPPTPVTPKPKPVSTPRPKPAPAVAKSTPQPAARAIVKARPDTSHNPPPNYPEMARRNGWEGKVIVRAHVSAQGRVTAVSIHQGSRYGVLNQAALAAVKSWRFRPGSIGGQATDSVVEVPVNFSLRR